jgi:hypothetical protein
VRHSPPLVVSIRKIRGGCHGDAEPWAQPLTLTVFRTVTVHPPAAATHKRTEIGDSRQLPVDVSPPDPKRPLCAPRGAQPRQEQLEEFEKFVGYEGRPQAGRGEENFLRTDYST